MLLFDIDATLSPPRIEEAPETSGEFARAFGFSVFIPAHLLRFLRAREDIVLLSTWGPGSFDLPRAFRFKARVALLEDFTKLTGIKGKFEVVKALKPLGWADDAITPTMRAHCKTEGIVTATPKQGYITEKELEKFIDQLTEAPARSISSKDSLLHETEPLERRK